MKLNVLFACLVMLLFTGCAQLVERAEESDVLLKYAIERETLDYIANDAGNADADQVTKVIERAEHLQKHIDKSKTLTLGLLQDYFEEEVDWDSKSMAEARDTRFFINALSTGVARRLDTGQDTEVVVGFFIDTVLNTVEPYR